MQVKMRGQYHAQKWGHFRWNIQSVPETVSLELFHLATGTLFLREISFLMPSTVTRTTNGAIPSDWNCERTQNRIPNEFVVLIFQCLKGLTYSPF